MAKTLAVSERSDPRTNARVVGSVIRMGERSVLRYLAGAMDAQVWLQLSGYLYFCFIVALLVVVVLYKREPAAALAWTLAIVFMPVLGPLFFLMAGTNRVPRRLRRKLGHREEFERSFGIPDECVSHQEPFRQKTSDSRWHRVSEMLVGLGEPGPSTGNEVELYNNGRSAYLAIADAIEAAEHHIHVEYYILRDDEVGRRLIDLLKEKCKQGVEVRLVADGVGSRDGGRLLSELRAAGGQATTFLPPYSVRRASPHLRNHRKIVICDGVVGFFGGLNVGIEYLGWRAWNKKGKEWYDLHMCITGPAVWDLQMIFVEDWDYTTGERLADQPYFPPMSAAGPNTAQVIVGGPDMDPNPIREAFFAAFTGARQRIVVATPYIAPDLAVKDALVAAARSGVEVHVVTQSWPPDSYLAYFCSRSFVEQMVEAGVHVHAFTPGMMHAKAVVVDGEWAMLGTANLDNRSLRLNFEQMTLFEGEVAGTTSAELDDLMGRCREITRDELAKTPRLQRLLIAAARLFAPLI